jgi:ribosome-associated translation inhibitor RaiA
MHILVNSDHRITGTEALTERVEGVVADAVGHFADRITRIEVHLNDVNGDKQGDNDKRCMLEARVGGLKPIAVTHQAAHMAEALHGAAEKLERALSHALERLDETPGREPREEEVASLELLQRLEQTENGGRRS